MVRMHIELLHAHLDGDRERVISGVTVTRRNDERVIGGVTITHVTESRDFKPRVGRVPKQKQSWK